MIGFTISYYITFEIRTTTMRIVLALVCTIPFWTSNVIRMISWIPLLGRNGLVNQTLMSLGLVSQPQEWLLYSDFAVTLAFVHLNTVFMIVPIVNSMSRIDRALIEAAYDAGATGWQTLWNVIIPLSKTGIMIGSIFVITVVMGDFITIGLMGGQQIASVGKVINVQIGYLQFPIAAANAIILLAIVLMIVWTHGALRRHPQGALSDGAGTLQNLLYPHRHLRALRAVPLRADDHHPDPVLPGTGWRPDLPDERGVAALVQGPLGRQGRALRLRCVLATRSSSAFWSRSSPW